MSTQRPAEDGSDGSGAGWMAWAGIRSAVAVGNCSSSGECRSPPR